MTSNSYSAFMEFLAAIFLIIMSIGPASAAAYGTPSKQSTQIRDPGIAQADHTCRNIQAFGADSTGLADSDEAFVKASVPSINGVVCVYFPSGLYHFKSRLIIAPDRRNVTASVILSGDGQNATVLQFPPNVSGIEIRLSSQFQSTHIRDLSVLATGLSDSTVGIGLSQNQALVSNPANTATSDISFVTVRGQDGYGGSSGWGIGVNVFGMSNLNIISSEIVGDRSTSTICLQDSGTSKIVPVVLNISNSSINYCNVGILYGDFLQGMSISQSNFTGDNKSIFCPPGRNVLAQLSVGLSQFNSYRNDIDLESAIDGVEITGNEFYVSGNNSDGIFIRNSHSYAIVGNSFVGTGDGDAGIDIDSYQDGSGVVSDNIFRNLFVGINLRELSRSVLIGLNSFSSVRIGVQNISKNNTIPDFYKCSSERSRKIGKQLISHC